MSDQISADQPTLPMFPFPGDFSNDLPPGLRQRRDAGTMTKVQLASGHTAWLAVRYDDVRLVSTDRRFSRAEASRPDAPYTGPISMRPPSDLPVIVNLDPPDHTRIRKLVSGTFSPRRVEALRPRIEQIVAERLDAIEAAGRPADLVSQFAVPVPVTVICELLGAPQHGRDLIHRCADVLITVAGRTEEEVAQAQAELLGYLSELIADKRQHPGDDLLSGLIAARDNDDQLSEVELLVLAATLLIAGHETTANQIGSVVVTLLEHPDQLARLRAEPGLLPTAVEELLRFVPLGSEGGFGIRIATDDVEVGGVTVRAGEAVIPARYVANRDPAVFTDPDRLDVGRQERPHIAFGAGIHYCLGAQLARMELQISLTALLRRYPDLRLAVPASELVWRQGMAQRGLAELPVTW